jgi:hypothetical protein
MHQIDLASADAHQANELIDRRTFSWTDLFNRFETTAPDDLRIASVRPRLEPKIGIVITVTVLARTVEDVKKFMDRLLESGAFTGKGPVEDHYDEQGLLISTLEFEYKPGPAKPAAAADGTATP